MIAQAQYRCTGSEQVEDGNTIIPAAVSSGATVTNLFVNGAGQTAFGDEVNMMQGKIRLAGFFPKGSIIKWLYKTLPNFSVAIPEPTMVDFESADFESSDFA